MMLGQISTRCPFDDAHLHWCEAGFAVADVRALSHTVPVLGPVTVDLPDDLQNAVAKRRSEFLAGRFCAALALRQAGISETVGRNGRAPLWPVGVTGSITHSKDRAIAAVSTQHDLVGLDCEALVSHDRATQLCSAIFSEAEARLRPDALPYGTFFTLVFSAKEALYKALAPRLDRVPDFLDVTLTGLARGEMRLVLGGQTHRAQFVLSQRDCVTLVVA